MNFNFFEKSSFEDNNENLANGQKEKKFGNSELSVKSLPFIKKGAELKDKFKIDSLKEKLGLSPLKNSE